MRCFVHRRRYLLRRVRCATHRSGHQSTNGSGRPAEDIPRLLALYQEGKLKLRELVSRTYSVRDINEAFAALARGDGARGVILW